MTALVIVAGAVAYLAASFGFAVLIGRCCVVGRGPELVSPQQQFLNISDEAHAIVRAELVARRLVAGPDQGQQR